jgi:uncharacterized membrane protein
MPASKDRFLLGGFNVESLNLFSEAIFAFSMTLLAVDIRLPEIAVTTQLPSELFKLIPRFVSFLIAFWIAAGFWIGHHRVFGLIKKHDRMLIYLNLLFLMLVTLLPFSTNLIGRFPTEQIVVVIAAMLFTATSTALGLLWVHASSGHRLVDVELSSDFIRGLTLRFFISPIVFLSSIPFSFLNPFYTVIAWPVLVLPMNFIADRRIRSRYERQTRT